MPQNTPKTGGWPEYVVIGQVLRPHGVRGALRVLPLTDHPRRFEKNRIVFLSHQGQKRQRFSIAQALMADGGVVLLQLAELTSREAAAEWRGAIVEIPGEEVTPLPAGEYYIFELIGLGVETQNGQKIGTLCDIQSYPWHDIYVVRNDQREYLIPAVAEIIVKVDTQAGVIIINAIDGLLD